MPESTASTLGLDGLKLAPTPAAGLTLVVAGAAPALAAPSGIDDFCIWTAGSVCDATASSSVALSFDCASSMLNSSSSSSVGNGGLDSRTLAIGSTSGSATSSSPRLPAASLFVGTNETRLRVDMTESTDAVDSLEAIGGEKGGVVDRFAAFSVQAGAADASLPTDARFCWTGEVDRSLSLACSASVALASKASTMLWTEDVEDRLECADVAGVLLAVGTVPVLSTALAAAIGLMSSSISSSSGSRATLR